MSEFSYRVLIGKRGSPRWPIVSNVQRGEANMEAEVERSTKKHGLQKFRLVGTAGNIMIYESVE